MTDTLQCAPTELELALSANRRHKEFLRRCDAKAAALRVAPAPATWEEAAPALPPMPALSAGEFYKECWFLIEGVSSKRPTIKEIKSVVMRHFGVPDEAMIVGRRRVDWLHPRQIAMYFCNTLTTKGMPEIGRAFGDADHTTVLHAGRRVPVLMRRDAAFAAVVAKLQTQLEESL